VISATQVYEKVKHYMVCSWKLNSAKIIYYKGMQLIISCPENGQLAKGQCQV
jgi:hypothetical protein